MNRVLVSLGLVWFSNGWFGKVMFGYVRLCPIDFHEK